MAIGNKVAVGRSDEVTSVDGLKASFAELIATFLFVFIGVGSVISYNSIHEGELDAAGLTVIALAHGIAIFITVAATAGISGGHVNPAVTFGLAIVGKITILRGLLYWIGQLVGAAAASYLLKFVLPHAVLPIHTLSAAEGVWGGLILEAVLTFSLVFVIFATAVDAKSPIAPLAIGFTVLIAHFVGVPYTGASLNPARSFGPAFAAWDFTDHYVYWIGPLVGGGIAAILYDEIFLAPPPHHGHPTPAGEY